MSSHTPSSCISSPNWQASSIRSPERGVSQPIEANIATAAVVDENEQHTPARAELTTSSQDDDDESYAECGKTAVTRSMLRSTDSDQSLLSQAKDSVEDLRSTVSRSPRSSDRSSRSPRRDHSEIPPSPTRPFDESANKLLRSPSKLRKKQRQKEQLIVNLAETEFSIESRRRPVSPFGEGFFRRIVSGGRSPGVETRAEELGLSGEALSATATVTEFPLGVWEEVEELERAQREWAEAKQRVTGKQAEAQGSKTKLPICERTTQEKRGGKGLMGLLGRRVSKEEHNDSPT